MNNGVPNAVVPRARDSAARRVRGRAPSLQSPLFVPCFSSRFFSGPARVSMELIFHFFMSVFAVAKAQTGSNSNSHVYPAQLAGKV